MSSPHLADYPHDPRDPHEAVRRVVADARSVAGPWGATGLRERAAVLRSWRGRLWRNGAELADLLAHETGLPMAEAMREVLACVEHLRWVETNVERVLGVHTATATGWRPDRAARTSYAAEGVVGVVVRGRTRLQPVASAMAVALAGGNTVVVDPGPLVSQTLTAWAGLLEPGRTTTRRLQVLEPAGAGIASALAGCGPDHVVLLGPPAGSPPLAAACARASVSYSVVPVVAPITLVAPDADLDGAARAVSALVAAAAMAAATVDATADANGGADAAREVPQVFVAPDVLAAFTAALDMTCAAGTGAVHPAALALGPASGATGPDPDAGASPPRRRLGAVTRRRPPPPRAPERVPMRAPMRASVDVRSAPGFEELLARVRAHPGAEVAVHSRRHGGRLAELLDCATVVVVNPDRIPGPDALPREVLGARGWGVFGGDDGLRTFVHARTVTAPRGGAAARVLAVPVALGAAPADALLATPAGRLATRLALHVRHSLG